jgi:hypothetical protein
VSGVNLSVESYDKSSKLKFAVNQIKDKNGGYYLQNNCLVIKSFPESFFEDIPWPIRPVIRLALESEQDESYPMRQLENLILHEGTHAYIHQNVAKSQRETFRAVNEAAARSVSQIYGRKKESPAKRYREKFNISIMQTAEAHFQSVAEKYDSKARKISKIREEAVEIERKIIANPEKDLLSVIKEGSKNDELRKIKSFIYLLERIEYRMTDFLAYYAIFDIKDTGRIKKINKYVENELVSSVEDQYLAESPSIFERKIDKKLLGPKVKESVDDKEEHLSEISRKISGENEVQNLLSQFAAARKELIELIEEFEKHIQNSKQGVQKSYSKSELSSLKEDKEKLESLIEEISLVLKEVTKNKEFNAKLRDAESNILRDLDNDEILEIIKDPNRNSANHLKKGEKSLEHTVKETIVSWRTVLEESRNVNKEVLDLCKRIHGNAEIIKKDVANEEQKYKIEKKNSGINKMIKKRMSEFEIELNEVEKILELTEDLYEFSLSCEKEANSALRSLDEAEKIVEDI